MLTNNIDYIIHVLSVWIWGVIRKGKDTTHHWASGKCNNTTSETTQNLVIKKKKKKLSLVLHPRDSVLSWKTCFVNLKAIFPAGHAWVGSLGESTVIALSSPGTAQCYLHPHQRRMLSSTPKSIPRTWKDKRLGLTLTCLPKLKLNTKLLHEVVQKHLLYRRRSR